MKNDHEMDTERWQKIKKLFKAGLSRKPQDRPAFLDEACGDDAALHGEV